MPRLRSLIALTLALAMLAALPPAALAGSAGDNQYVDPLSGQHKGSTSTHSSSPSSNSSSSSAGATTTPAASTPAPAPAATTATTTVAATTTAADPSGGTKADGKTLPFTGYEDWQAAALGGALLAGGLLLRRRVRA